MSELDYAGPWYHGSASKFPILRKGSSITQDRDLARTFSHNPRNVSISVRISISDDGSRRVSQKIKHDGEVSGYLYRVAEDVGPEDLCPNPNSSLEPGKEMLTNRDLKVELLGPTQIVDEERLSEEEILKLTRKGKGKDQNHKPFNNWFIRSL